MKKLISILLTIAMVLSLLPGVFADEPFTAQLLCDMEDLTNEGLFGNDPCPFSSYQVDKMTLQVAEGKGYNGSKALD